MIGKLKLSFFMAIALTCFAIFVGCQPNNRFTTTLKAGDTGTFRFPTRNVEGFRDLTTGDNAYDAKGLGTLYLHSKASQKNKVAVMVILHGSGGRCQESCRIFYIFLRSTISKKCFIVNFIS